MPGKLRTAFAYAAFLTIVLAGACTIVSGSSEAQPRDHAPSVLGPIPVVTVDSIIIYGPDSTRHEALGRYDYDERVIQVISTLKGRWRQMVIYHEACHAALYDFGLTKRIVGGEEQICDAIGYAWSAKQ